MSGKRKMSEEKARKIAVAATAAGVLIVLFLAVILTIQFVRIGVANAERRRIENEIERYEQLLEEKERDIDYYESELGMYHEALKQGWHTK